MRVLAAAYASTLAGCVLFPDVYESGVVACHGDGDCLQGYRCRPSDAVCVRTGEDTAALGESCTADVDCDGWACFVRYPEGMCTAECDTDADCPDNSHCGLVDGATRLHCLPDCTADADCRVPAYGCFDVDTDGRRECHPLAQGTGVVGDPCIDLTDCTGGTAGRCNTAWSGGYCVTVDCPATPCPAGTHCVFSGGGSGAGKCYADCATSDDCRAPAYDCYDYDLEGGLECAPVGHGAGAVGAACTRIEDCGGGRYALCNHAARWTAGYCIIGACGAATTCPTASHCAWAWNDGGGSCLADCASDADCRTPAYGCFDYDFDPASAPECIAVGSGTSPIGGPCIDTGDCSGGPFAFCVPPLVGNPGGYCSMECGPGTRSCPDGSVCIGTDNPICMDACAVREDCRPGFDCILFGDADPVCGTLPE